MKQFVRLEVDRSRAPAAIQSKRRVALLLEHVLELRARLSSPLYRSALAAPRPALDGLPPELPSPRFHQLGHADALTSSAAFLIVPQAATSRETKLPLREGNASNHVGQLPIRDVPGSCAEPAIGGHLDPIGIAEHVDGIQDAVPNQLRGFHEIGVDVEHAKTQDGLVREVAEHADHGVPRPCIARSPELASVVVREPHRELPTSVHRFYGREEQLVIGEAQMCREDGIQSLHGDVEALHEQVEFFPIRRRARLVDLDPDRPQADEGLQVRPYQLPSDLQDERATSLMSRAPALGGRKCEIPVLEEELVEGPVGDRVWAGDRDLQH